MPNKMINAKPFMLCLAAAFCLLALTGGHAMAQEAASTESVIAPIVMDAPPSDEAINPARVRASIMVCEEENVVSTKCGEIGAISG